MFSVRVATRRTPEWELRKWPLDTDMTRRPELHQKQRSASHMPLLTLRFLRHFNVKIFNRVRQKVVSGKQV